MKNVLILGLGGTGAHVAELFSAYRQNVSCFVLDSDTEAISEISRPKVCMTDNMSLGNAIEKMGADTVSEFFPCESAKGKSDYVKTLEMGKGANGWRMKGLLSFEYMLSDPEKSGAFQSALDALVNKNDLYENIEIDIVASLIGGTGSALFLPVALYIKRYFKSKFGRDVVVNALLACSDIFSGVLTSENKVKAYANAYAALQELNAVELLSKGYNKEAKAASRCLIKYKIGSEKSRMGVLFDSSKPEFSLPTAQPFGKVYLFDKVPGMETVPAHERALARILKIIIDSENDQNNQLFACLSIAEVVFDGDKIVDYVAKKKVFDDMDVEWRLLYEKARGGDADDNVDKFAENFTRIYRSLCSQNYYSQNLALGRTSANDICADDENGDVSVSMDAIGKYAYALADRCFAMLDNKSAKEAKAEISDTDKDVLQLRLFDSKSAKNKKLQVVHGKAELYNRILLEYFKSGLAIVRDKKDRMTAELLSAKDENSILNNLIIRNGKYLHPVTALLLLCETYIALRANIHGVERDKIFKEAFTGSELPKFLFEWANLENNVNREYAKFGPTRLKTVAATQTDALPIKIVEAFSDIKQDFVQLYTYISAKLSEQLMGYMLDTLASLIKKYQSLFDAIPFILSDHKTDVKLALVANTSDTCTLMNVGCSEDNKNRAYVKYKNDGSANAVRDDITGKIFFEHALGCGRENLFGDLCKAETISVCNNREIQAACKCDIFRVLLDKDIFNNDLPDRTAYRDFERAFALVPMPLDLQMRDGYTNNRVDVQTVTMVPVAAAQFAQSRLCDKDLSLGQAAEKYVYMQGVFESSVRVADSLAANKMFTMQKMSGFPLYLFNKANENCEGLGYYKFYKKAMAVKKTQDSQMWNPHLIKENLGDFLPFIDPAKRDEFEKNAYKAVLYMLQNGVFCVEQAEGNKDYFCYKSDDAKIEAHFENKRVTSPVQLFGFIRENTDLAELYGSAFDREFEKECSLLPSVGFEKTDLPKLKDAILRGKTFRLLSGDLMANVRAEKPLGKVSMADILCAAAEKEETQSEAEGLGKTVVILLKTLAASRPLSDEELTHTLYCELLDCLKLAWTAKQGATADLKKAFSFVEYEKERD